MKKIKVMTVVGTRPEIIRLSSVIHKLNKSESINHILVHTGQNYDYELNEIFFDDFDLDKPDYFLNAAEENAIQTTGRILIEIDKILEKENPDAFLVLGDTNSCLCAIAAKKRKIPIFHMEAGNRCYDQRVPEETNRKIVDHISDINLTYSDIAREYLLREGISPDRIIKTGSPMYEILNKFPIIVSTHPRTRKMIEQKKVVVNPLVRFLKPLGFIDYNALQKKAFIVLSDSGTINEESSILNFRALNIREAHERPEAMEEASTMMVGLNPERILQGIEQVKDQKINDERDFILVKDYSMPNVSKKVVRVIISYIDYINRVVWNK